MGEGGVGGGVGEGDGFGLRGQQLERRPKAKEGLASTYYIWSSKHNSARPAINIDSIDP